MPVLNWEVFAQLAGSAEDNFETLCRILIRRHYEAYGNFAALAFQPGVEFHLKLHSDCSLGTAGRWYGWQCRWYKLQTGHALGSARRRKIEEALRTTEKVLPNLTDWVLWTKNPLTAGDQRWFYRLKTKYRLHLWTGKEIAEHLSGEAEIFRATYFGDLVLSPQSLATSHQKSIAPIRLRWLPEVHQIVDVERTLGQMLAESGSWDYLRLLSEQLKDGTREVKRLIDAKELTPPLQDLIRIAVSSSDSISQIYGALVRGELDLVLSEQVDPKPLLGRNDLAALPRIFRAQRRNVALYLTNVIADIRSVSKTIEHLCDQVGRKLICVRADVGCGKTQLAAQLTNASKDRPAGILLHGRALHAATISMTSHGPL
jgi:hypothetical protein